MSVTVTVTCLDVIPVHAQSAETLALHTLFNMSASKDNHKVYSASEFRGQFPADAAHSGPVKRHALDCEIIADAAAGSPGPRYSEDTVRAQ